MRKLLLIWLLCLPSYASLVHSTAVAATCSPTCTLPIPSTGAGNLLVLIPVPAGSSLFSTASVSGGGTWVGGSGTCFAGDNVGTTTTEMWYVLNSTGSTTSISVTLNYSNTQSFVVNEYHGSGTWHINGACSILTAQAATVTPTTAAISSSVGDLIVSAIAHAGIGYGAGTVSAITCSGWTSPVLYQGGGVAVIQDLNSSGGTCQASTPAFVSGSFGAVSLDFTNSAVTTVRHRVIQ